MKRKNSILISLLTAAIITSQAAYADTTPPPEKLPEETDNYSISLPVAPGTEEDLGLDKEPDTLPLIGLEDSTPIEQSDEAAAVAPQEDSIPWETLTPAEKVPTEIPEEEAPSPNEQIDDLFVIQPGDKTRKLPDYKDFIPDGYTFLGWNTDKDAAVGYFECKEPTKNVALYGIWRKDTSDTIPPINISEDIPTTIPLL